MCSSDLVNEITMQKHQIWSAQTKLSRPNHLHKICLFKTYHPVRPVIIGDFSESCIASVIALFPADGPDTLCDIGLRNCEGDGCLFLVLKLIFATKPMAIV